MFVQSHFQRARHQATGANSASLLSSSASAGHNHKHSHSHQTWHTHGHSSGPHNHLGQHQQHTNHGHSEARRCCQHLARARAAIVNQHAQTNESCALKIKCAASVTNCRVDQNQKYAHCSRQGESELSGKRNEQLLCYDKLDATQNNIHYSHANQMSSTNSANRLGFHTIGRREGSPPTTPVRAPASTSTKTESSTTVRLRLANESKLAPQRPFNNKDNNEGRDSHLANYYSLREPPIDRVNCSRIRQTGQSRASLRNSLFRSSRRGATSRKLRLERAGVERIKLNHFDHQLERFLSTLIGPCLLVGRSLTNKIISGGHNCHHLNEVDRHTQAASIQHQVTSSHINLCAPTEQIKQTFNCLTLFCVNYLQVYLHLLCNLIIRIKGKVAHLLSILLKSNYCAPKVMRAQRRQGPPPTRASIAAGGGAYSFDASRSVLPRCHEISPLTIDPSYYLTHQHAQNQQQKQTFNSDWLHVPMCHSSVANHVHRHNHTADSLASSSCYRQPLDLLPAARLQSHQYLTPPISRFRSLDCDTKHDDDDEPYANYVQHNTQRPLVSSQQQFVQPTRGSNISNHASQIWNNSNDYMRHTLDYGYLPGHEEQVESVKYLPFDSSYNSNEAQPASSAAGSQLHAHESHWLPAQSFAGRFSRQTPQRQRVASISSPTLSDYDSTECWPGVVLPIDTTHQASPYELSPPVAYQPASGDCERVQQQQRQQVTITEHQVSNRSRPGRRQLPSRPPPLKYGIQANGQPAAYQFSANSHASKLPDRRLSSIMSSDSELYMVARRDNSRQVAPTSGAYHNNSSDDASSSVSSASRQRANANLMRFRLSKHLAHQQQHQKLPAQKPVASSLNNTLVDSTADRGRFARQASSTSTVSQSYANSAANEREQTGDAPERARRGAKTLKLPHQFSSLQTDSPSRHKENGNQSIEKQPNRPTKSDSECKSPDVMSNSIGTGNGDQQANATSCKAKCLVVAGGKSKWSGGGHASSIGVLGRAVSLAGAKRRLGFKQKGGLNSLSVHRSEEYFPARCLDPGLGGSGATTGSNSLNSDSCELPEPSSSSSASRWLTQYGATNNNSGGGGGGASGVNLLDPRVCFVEGLGAGQIASRQALVSPYLGNIQVSLSDRRGMLEVEIIRVRQLQAKPGAKRLPSPYVKVYLMRNKKCAAKFKTRQLQQTLEPLYQQLFIFRDSDYSNCVLQIIVWADYGKKDRKSLMGIVQIHLNDLDMSQVVVGWYRLFNARSMVAATASSPNVANSSKALRQTLSSTKLGDLATIQKQRAQQVAADEFKSHPMDSQHKQQQQQQQI